MSPAIFTLLYSVSKFYFSFSVAVDKEVIDDKVNATLLLLLFVR